MSSVVQDQAFQELADCLAHVSAQTAEQLADAEAPKIAKDRATCAAKEGCRRARQAPQQKTGPKKAGCRGGSFRHFATLPFWGEGLQNDAFARRGNVETKQQIHPLPREVAKII